MKYILICAILLIGCTPKPQSLPQSPAATPSPIAELTPPIAPTMKQTPIGKDKSDELFRLLKGIGVKPLVNDSQTLYTAFDLSCSIAFDGGGSKTSCEYFETPLGTKNRKAIRVNKTKEAEGLRSFLFQYPVNQGDPGAETAFVQCRSHVNIDKSVTADCYLAVNLNYEGP